MMRMILKPRVRQGLKIALMFLSVPFIAWTLEFAYNHFLAPRFRRTTTPHMILSNQDGEVGYDYAGLNSLLRKVRRLEMHHSRNIHEFKATSDYIDQVANLIIDLEAEYRHFTAYYYSLVDLYTKSGMPDKLRRRLLYYRDIIKKAIASSQRLGSELDSPVDDLSAERLS